MDGLVCSLLADMPRNYAMLPGWFRAAPGAAAAAPGQPLTELAGCLEVLLTAPVCVELVCREASRRTGLAARSGGAVTLYVFGSDARGGWRANCTIADTWLRADELDTLHALAHRTGEWVARVDARPLRGVEVLYARDEVNHAVDEALNREALLRTACQALLQAAPCPHACARLLSGALLCAADNRAVRDAGFANTLFTLATTVR